MAESAISPGELFSKHQTKDIKQLVRKDSDKFFVFTSKEYADVVKKYLAKVQIKPSYKKYLIDLVSYSSLTTSHKDLSQSFDTNYKDIDVNEVKKYFGEVLGPLYLISKNKGKFKNVIFPVRSNYELFDFFLEDTGGKYHGYSSKIEGGTSNTLSPKEIESRIAKLKNLGTTEKLPADVITLFTKEPTLQGIIKAVGLLVDKNKMPSKLPKTLLTALKKINFDGDASIIERNKTNTLDKVKLSNNAAHIKFMNEYILPRLRSVPDADKKKYEIGNKHYTGTNLAYGYGLLIVDANSDGVFDISPLVKKCFQDLNIVKMGLGAGIPNFTLKLVSESEDKYYLRSKHRFDVIKDKLGVQL